uniref:Short-chain dehydrogenase n=1 Tax=Acrobeloides nanus TaxID=290746 RepID=A0A914CEC0_9BILA
MASGVGKNVFITGANRGIGYTMVEELAKNYDVKRIFAGCRNPDGAESLIALKNQYPSVHLIKVDVQDDISIKNAAEEVGKILGEENLNLLINNAGIAENVFDENSGGNFEAPDRDYYARHFDVNIIGVVMVSSAFLPMLKKAAAEGERSLLVNISSSMASISIGSAYKILKNGNITYSLTKIALNHYSRLTSKYLESAGVIVAAIAPGWVATDMGSQLPIAGFNVDPKYSQEKPLTPEESVQPLMKTIAELKSENSGSYMNRFGEILPD